MVENLRDDVYLATIHSQPSKKTNTILMKQTQGKTMSFVTVEN